MTDNVVLFPKTPPVIFREKRTRKPKRIEKELRQCVNELDLVGLSGFVFIGIPKTRNQDPAIMWTTLNDVTHAQQCVNEALYQINAIRMTCDIGYEDVETDD